MKIQLFASRIHNENILSDIDEIDEENNEDIDRNKINAIKINNIMKVKVIGFRFEINDPYLSVLGEIIKDEPKIIMD